MTSAVATPIALAAVVYYAVQGLKLANGDPAPLHSFVPQLIRVGVVIWLSSNLDAFNLWVRDVFFTGLPNALAAAVDQRQWQPGQQSDGHGRHLRQHLVADLGDRRAACGCRLAGPAWASSRPLPG